LNAQRLSAKTIFVDESGGRTFPNVWTGTRNDGTAAFTCGDWFGDDGGTYGSNDFPVASAVWSGRGLADCSDELRLYCFEQ
jgi:hypothetical protein